MNPKLSDGDKNGPDISVQDAVLIHKAKRGTHNDFGCCWTEHLYNWCHPVLWSSHLPQFTGRDPEGFLRVCPVL